MFRSAVVLLCLIRDPESYAKNGEKECKSRWKMKQRCSCHRNKASTSSLIWGWLWYLIASLESPSFLDQAQVMPPGNSHASTFTLPGMLSVPIVKKLNTSVSVTPHYWNLAWGELHGLIKDGHFPYSSPAIPMFSILGASGVGVLLKMNGSLSPTSLFLKHTFPLHELNCGLDISPHLIQSFLQNRV